MGILKKNIKGTLTLAALFTLGCQQDVQFESNLSKDVTDSILESEGSDKDLFKVHTQDFAINSDDLKIDILFVVDNSASMVSFQNNMKSRIDGFMEKISHLNYQIAVTSTDILPETRDEYNQVVKWGDGQFRSFSSGGKDIGVLSSSNGLSLTEAERVLGNAIQMGPRGGGDERGIFATYRAIERRQSDKANKDFFRNDSALAVVLISDEDECSTGGCLSFSPKSQPDELLRLVDKEFGANKLFSFHSILHPPAGCPQAHDAAHVGNTYEELSKKTGGIIGDICAEDYANQLSEIGKSAESLVRSVRLACAPKDVNGDGKVDISILKDGKSFDSNVKVSKDRLTFNSSLELGSYSIKYYCSK